MIKILLADDDTELTDLLEEYLTPEGFDVVAVHDGVAAVEAVKQHHFELLVLDVMMPEMNGFEVLRQVRKFSAIPVIMLTARGDDVDSIVGLEIGADDYLAKPCNPRVLVAHIRAILRRTESSESTDVTSDSLLIDNVEIQRGARRVFLADKPVSMTSTEYCVLEILMEHAGEVVLKEDLSQLALRREHTIHDRSLDMHISKLRKKLGPISDEQERIKTVRGIGYQYVRITDA